MFLDKFVLIESLFGLAYLSLDTGISTCEAVLENLYKKIFRMAYENNL
jgi:hypothetical protein